MKDYKIRIKDNGVFDYALITKKENTIYFKFKDLILKEEDVFPFRALQRIRETLEGKNIFLMINGSRKDVFPSGMKLYSDLVYVLKTNNLTNENDLINIFDDVSNDSLISTVKEQSDYHLAWGEAIKNR